ncbi:MAG: helix-turn-helix domain-containing protein [Oscillospiraceae bacterium]|nr:helix-turn-helix domain-containing protein [Oscillospiraceae bacterium]
MKIGNNIKALRLRREMTQEALALRLGVTSSAVGNYERGVSFPKDDVLERLFGALGCTPNELFGAEELLTDEEYELLEKYRALDAHGKRLVNACAEIELDRLAEEDEEFIAVAARKGAEKSRVKLKKRAGKSIRELPDYYNKGDKK